MFFDSLVEHPSLTRHLLCSIDNCYAIQVLHLKQQKFLSNVNLAWTPIYDAEEFEIEPSFYRGFVALASTSGSIQVLKYEMPKLSNTTVVLHTTNTFLGTFWSHFITHRKKWKGTPKEQFYYHEGLNIVRKFLKYAETRTVGELQKFTGNRVPIPRWVSKEVVAIPHSTTELAARYLVEQLEMDPDGLKKIGGANWWKFRGKELEAEWIEMKKDKDARGDKQSERIILYVHGGAYFFSSLETHRYQIQRHARKLKARAFAPSYRLSPQYPFPCALHDILSAYLFLISPPPGPDSPAPIHPSQIVLYGDSSGAGCIVSLLVLLRDRGLPLPSGGVLISPWVDLSHSFPSCLSNDSEDAEKKGDGHEGVEINGVEPMSGKGDYIPGSGFVFRAGCAWPPPLGEASRKPEHTDDDTFGGRREGVEMILEEGGKKEWIDEQVQLYCPNSLIGHPLVSPVLQGNLGGLPPLLILGGSTELLADEITYLGHKASSPAQYPPSSVTLSTYPSQRKIFDTEFDQTIVQLSIYDSCAHVTTTLSITKVAKFMYRECEEWGSKCLEGGAKLRAEAVEIEGGAMDQLSVPNNDSRPDSTSSDSSQTIAALSPGEDKSIKPTLPCHDSMVRHRVSPHGIRRPMEPTESISCLNLNPNSIGHIKTGGPILKWIEKRKEWDRKYSKELKYWRKLREADREVAEASGFYEGRFKDREDRPPLCSVAGVWDQKLAKEMMGSVDLVSSGKGKGVKVQHRGETKLTESASVGMRMWSWISTGPDKIRVVGAQHVERG